MIRTLILFAAITAHAYEPPIGIPDPADTFGVFGEIDQDAPAGSSNWPSAEESGYYYIDKTHVSATDTANTYGYPDKPRLTVPNVVFSAGDRIEIHGDGGTAEYSGTWDPSGVGTAANPIWFIGVDTPVFTGKMDMGSANRTERSYMVFDGLKWANGTGSGGKIDLRPRYANNSIHHIIFRDCTLRGRAATGQGTGFAVGSASFVDTQVCNDIVFYNGEISHYGDKDSPNEECAVYPSFYVTRFWVLDSDIHDCAEDGFAGSHGGNRTSTEYYIGRNNIYDNLTDPMDIKGMGVVIASENTVWGHYDVWVEGVHKSSGAPAAMSFHYSGDSTGPYWWDNYPADASLLYNTITNGRSGLWTSSCGKLRVVGNVFYNTRHEPSDYTDTPFAIEVGGIHGDTWIVGNTVYDCEGGILIKDEPLEYDAGTTYYRGETCRYNGATYRVLDTVTEATGVTGVLPTNTGSWAEFRVQIYGNIVSNTYNSAKDIQITGSNFWTNSVDADYNLIYNSGGVSFTNYSAQTNDLTSAPLFVDAANDNFLLQSSSPAIGAGSAGTGTTVYADFLATHGRSIQVDRAGNSRPQGGTWDMGAYEYTATAIPRTPAAARRAALLAP